MRSFIGAVVLFSALSVVMTWPQAAHFSTHTDRDQDVFFNLWRFGWVAHALATAPSRVLDGNTFYPERRTLTLSDAMPVEAAIAAPLLWSGVPPVAVHNLLLLGGIVLSAAGIFVLAVHLTGSRAAGVTAGIIFAFVPYRFAHYMHMELQWTVWTPWAFWALHRTFETGLRRYGVMLGVFVALQFMSSIYYGLFLGTLLAVCAVLLFCGAPRGTWRMRLGSLCIAALVGAVLITPYALPYLGTRRGVGGRPEQQVLMFSARASSYTVATETNYLYGTRSAPRARLERLLFPGVTAVLLAVTGLLLVPATTEAIVYLLALAAAFEMSLGLYGYSFSFLYYHVPLFDGLRAPARLGIFVVFFLAILAARGHAALEAASPRRLAPVLLAVVSGVLLLEYWSVPLRLVPVPNNPPPLYAWLATQPRGVVAEFPTPNPEALPGLEPRYAYMSTFHWMPTLNGYSGYYPSSYISRLEALDAFPGERAVETLRRSGVRYVIVHPDFYDAERRDRVLGEVAASLYFAELGRFDDGLGMATVFRVR